MPAEFGIVYQLWNETLTPRDLLERVAGEVGLDHITVPVITGPRREFRLITPTEPQRSFATEGGWHYPPGSERYRPTGVVPRMARWAGKRDHLMRLCERAGELNLRIIFRVDLRGAVCESEQNARLRMRDAWDDDQPRACVAHAELRELLQTVLADLARYEPAGIELADWVLDAPARESTHWHTGAQRLAETCFCSACRQIAAQAGLDADRIARAVRVHVEHMLTHPDHDWCEVLAKDELLGAYRHGARQRESREWLAQLSKSHPQERQYLVERVGTEHVAAPAGWSRLLQLPLTTGSDDIEQRVRSLADCSAAASTAWGLSIPCWRPMFTDSAALVKMANKTAADANLIDFEGVATSLPEALTWLRQAVRFARRG